MRNGKRLLHWLGIVLILAVGSGPLMAEVLWRIPVEHNHRKGECRGTMTVRDDKVIFESRNVGCDRVWEYANLKRIDIKPNGYEFHVYFKNNRTGADEKYVLKFRHESPDNEEALAYIRGRMHGAGVSREEGPAPTADGFPYRLRVELDVNGPDCNGTLVLRDDKIIFETGSAACADRAFVREWDTLKSYTRVKPNEFLLVFYKYGRSAPDKVTRLRFRTMGAPVPSEIERVLHARSH